MGVRDAGGVFMGAWDAAGFAALEEGGLILLEVFEGFDDEIKRFKIPGGFAASAVDDQFLRAFGHVRIKVIEQHTEGGFLYPALAIQLRACRSSVFNGVVSNHKFNNPGIRPGLLK